MKASIVAGLIRIFTAVALASAASPAIAQQSAVAKTVTLADGKRLELQQWSDTYETLEYQPPIDAKKAKTIVAYPDLGLHVISISLDLEHDKIYWLVGSGGGRHGAICRADLDGANMEVLLKAFGKFEIEEARDLCVIPSLDKMFWVCRSPQGDTAQAIVEASLDGKNVKTVVAGLRSCFDFEADSVSRRLYWTDERKFWMANLDGTDEAELPLDVGVGSSFAIDGKNGVVYGTGRHHDFVRERLDGSEQKVLFNSRFEHRIRSVAHSALDLDAGYLYWTWESGIVRARLESPLEWEQLTNKDRLDAEPEFSIDSTHKRIYFTDGNSQKLLCADLPKPWPKVVKPAPPEIVSFSPSEVGIEDKVLIVGSGLRSARQVLWIAHPLCEIVESRFNAISDTQLEMTVPKWKSSAAAATIVVIGEGGATLTMPKSTVQISKVVEFNRGDTDHGYSYVVLKDSLFHQVEQRVVLVEAGGAAASGPRANSAYFVKSGGRICPQDAPAAIFYEPHAQLVAYKKASRLIPVPAIRPSFVDVLIRFKKRP